MYGLPRSSTFGGLTDTHAVASHSSLRAKPLRWKEEGDEPGKTLRSATDDMLRQVTSNLKDAEHFVNKKGNPDHATSLSKALELLERLHKDRKEVGVILLAELWSVVVNELELAGKDASFAGAMGVRCLREWWEEELKCSELIPFKGVSQHIATVAVVLLLADLQKKPTVEKFHRVCVWTDHLWALSATEGKYFRNKLQAISKGLDDKLSKEIQLQIDDATLLHPEWFGAPGKSPWEALVTSISTTDASGMAVTLPAPRCDVTIFTATSTPKGFPSSALGAVRIEETDGGLLIERVGKLGVVIPCKSHYLRRGRQRLSAALLKAKSISANHRHDSDEQHRLCQECDNEVREVVRLLNDTVLGAWAVLFAPLPVAHVPQLNSISTEAACRLRGIFGEERVTPEVEAGLRLLVAAIPFLHTGAHPPETNLMHQGKKLYWESTETLAMQFLQDLVQTPCTPWEVLSLRTLAQSLHHDVRALLGDDLLLRQHIVLIVGEGVHKLPWETVPVLCMARSSRVPSTEYLWRAAECYSKGSRDNIIRDGADSAKGFFVVDPDGREGDKILGMVASALGEYRVMWKGQVGRLRLPGGYNALEARSKLWGNILHHAVSCHNIFVFFGRCCGDHLAHDWTEGDDGIDASLLRSTFPTVSSKSTQPRVQSPQIIEQRTDVKDFHEAWRPCSHRLLRLPPCSLSRTGGSFTDDVVGRGQHLPSSPPGVRAACLLMGGDEGSTVALDYLEGGAAAVATFLWDVPPDESARIAEAVIKLWLPLEQNEAGKAGSSNAISLHAKHKQHPTSLPAAVRFGRMAAIFPHLTGAAAVCYGLPVFTSMR